MKMEEKIIEYLKKQTGPISTTAIAEDVVRNESLKEGKTEANRILYTLKSKGIAERIVDEKGRNPQWRYLSEKAEKREIVERELEHLFAPNEWILLKTIMNELKKSAVEKSLVNSILYSWAKKGKAEKKSDENGKNPCWKLL